MKNGYVLTFSDRTFAEFFLRFQIKIDDERFLIYGPSKAKRLRAFWDLESDKTVAKVLREMLVYGDYLNNKHPNLDNREKRRRQSEYKACLGIIQRLEGVDRQAEISKDDAESKFLKRNWGDLTFDGLGLDPTLEVLMAQRGHEALSCAQHGHSLSAIIIAGSVLEGLLLHVASLKPREFNLATCAPKQQGVVKPFPKWALSQLIDAAHECGYLREDAKKFSHVLRDFRNYIHPHQQMLSGFNPDRHTAEICLQVLKLSIISLKSDKPIKI